MNFYRTLMYKDGASFWAVYPYRESHTFSGEALTVSLPANQVAVAGSFADDLFVSIARTTNFNLQFYNVCGGIEFSVTEPGVKTVTFRGNGDEPLAGTAKVSFGADGKPVIQNVTDAATWRAALQTWVDDMLYMTLPTKCAQKLCAALFRQEVVSPTKFHAEFKKDFGRPVYDALRDLLSMAVEDEEALELWTTTVWAQVSVYALADAKWQVSFRPAGVSTRAWAEKVRDHICSQIFAALSFKKGASYEKHE